MKSISIISSAIWMILVGGEAFGQSPGWTTTGNVTYTPTGTKVGISTPNPLYLLHLVYPNAPGAEGEFALDLDRVYDSVGDWTGIKFGGGVGLGQGTGSIKAIASAPGQGALIFSAQNSANVGEHNEIMRVRGDGNVGIGTNIPNARISTNTAGLTGTTDVSAAFYGSTSTGTLVDVVGRTADRATLVVGSAWETAGGALANFYSGSGPTQYSRFYVRADGNVGIGTTTPQQKLSVNGTIGAREVVVTNSGWADYVFKPGYKLNRLSEVASYVAEHQHLPGIPTEAEIRKLGVSVGEMQSKLLAKVEELTLYLIQAEERNRALERRIETLEKPHPQNIRGAVQACIGERH